MTRRKEKLGQIDVEQYKYPKKLRLLLLLVMNECVNETGWHYSPVPPILAAALGILRPGHSPSQQDLIAREPRRHEKRDTEDCGCQFQESLVAHYERSLGGSDRGRVVYGCKGDQRKRGGWKRAKAWKRRDGRCDVLISSSICMCGP